MTLIQYSEGKFWLLENVMKEPKEKDFERFSGSQINGYAITHSLYCGSLQESIAARKEIINPELLKDLEWTFNEGDTFPLPGNLEFENKLKLERDDQGYEFYVDAIRLKLKVKEESQDELWNEVYAITCRYVMAGSIEKLNIFLKSKFTIKRNVI